MATEVAQGRKLRIISDGTRYGSRVLDAETGERIEHVRAVTISLGPVGELPTAQIEIMLPHVDVVVTADDVAHVCPYCGHEREQEGE